MPLTATSVRLAKPKDKDYKLTDGGGMYLLVRTNGAKYWRMAYRFGGRQKTLAIGVYPDLSLADARSIRDQARNQKALGLDPSQIKQNTKLEQRAAASNSFSSLANEWYTKQESHWAPSTAKKRRSLLDNDLIPYLGSRNINDLQTFQLLKCLQRIENRGAIETAHNGRQVLNQIFRYATQTQRCTQNPVLDLTGALKKKAVQHRAAITDPVVFGKLLVKIDQYQGSHIVRTMLALAPLLFQRPGEIASMEWSELDLRNKLWNIPKNKKKERNKRESDHLVPLSDQAVELIRDIEPLTGRGVFVFPNQRDYSRHASPASVNKALRNLGYDTKSEQSFHGFRASARTMLDERLGFRVDWIEHQSGRRVSDPMGRAYNRTEHLEQRAGMTQAWADYLDKLRHQVLSGNVIKATFSKSS
jgi:integrase